MTEPDPMGAFGQGYSPHAGDVERRADEPVIDVDAAPDPDDVWTIEMRNLLVGLANAVVLDFVQYVRDVDDEAIRIVCNHLVNDVHAAIDEALNLDGRGAARSARAVFEDCVLVAQIHADPHASARYLAHGAFDTLRLGENGLGIDRLSGKTRDKARNRLEKILRTAKRKARRARQQHPGVDKGWYAGSLRDLAVKFGWDQRYDKGYRVLSSVNHGSGAGVLGTRKGEGTDAVFRWGGASLEWVPVALLETFENIQLVVNEGQANWSGFEGANTQHALAHCFAKWPEMRSAVYKADRDFWPEEPTLGLMAIVGVYPKGDRWYMYDPLFDRIRVAEPPAHPDLAQKTWDNIDRIARDARARHGSGSNGRPVTIAVPGLKLVQRDDAPWMSSASILEPRDNPRRGRVAEKTISDPDGIEYEPSPPSGGRN